MTPDNELLASEIVPIRSPIGLSFLGDGIDWPSRASEAGLDILLVENMLA